MKYQQKYTKEKLEQAVKNNESIAGVLRELDIKLSGGLYSYIKSLIKKYQIDTSHFTGSAWNVKKKNPFGPKKLHFNEILVFNRKKGFREGILKLRRALLESGTEHKCNSCGLGNIWNGKKIVLEINHKDENFLNNQKDNLEFLCPNCHSQYRGIS